MAEDTQTARYSRVDELGSGGMGAVYLVKDHEWDTVVAQKRILADDPDYLLLFKREFRAVESLSHPNLVQLYELGEDEDGLFFTMEAVDGWDLGDYCRDATLSAPEAATQPDGIAAVSRDISALAPRTGGVSEHVTDVGSLPTLDLEAEPASAEGHDKEPVERADPDIVEKLLWTLPQILDALVFLHSREIVHRDLKPSNVLVSRDGTVKLVDFGIAGRVGQYAPGDKPDAPTGTVGYMAPEQIHGRAPQAASDIYALGAIVFELLAGRPVFEAGNSVAVMLKHVNQPAPDLAEVVDAVPRPLAALCRRALSKEPDDRPSAAELSRLLGRLDTLSEADGGDGPMVGRSRLRDRLDLFLGSGRVRGLVLTGPSGVGKSRLLDWAGRRAVERGATAMRGQGRFRDRIAFNAVDPIIDQLAFELDVGEFDGIDELRRTASVAFPVLGEASEHDVTRASVFDAVAQLLERVAGGDRVVLLVDDLQWADSDSIVMLEHLLADDGLDLRLLATLRDDLEASIVEDWLAGSDRIRRMTVQPLSSEAVRSLIEQRSGIEPPPALVESCEGRPFLAELASRLLISDGVEVGDVDASDTLVELLERGAQADRDVLALLDAADDWVEPQMLAQLLDCSVGELTPDLIRLERQGVLRAGRGPNGTETVDIYHSSVRRALDAWLDPAEVVSAHLRLARYFEAREAPPAHRVARHYEAAGRMRKAARWARPAAEAAEAQLAWSLAADMWAMVERAGPHDREHVARRCAEAMERAARYVEAAGIWRAIAERASDPDARRDAAIQHGSALLAANRVDEGYAVIEETIGASRGLGERLSEVLAAARFVAGPSKAVAKELARSDVRPAPEVAERARRDLQLAMRISFFDQLYGLAFLMRLRDELIEAGCRSQVAWCDYILAYLAHHRTSETDTPILARRYEETADIVLDHVIDAPRELDVFKTLLEATAKFRRGNLGLAIAQTKDAFDSLERIGVTGTFEYMYLLASRMRWVYMAQDVDTVAEIVGRFAQLGRRSEHFALVAHLRIAQVFLELYRGNFDEVRAVRDRFVGSIGRQTIHKLIVRGLSQIPAIWTGDFSEALETIREVFDEGERFRLSQTMFSSVLLGAGALVEATALRAGHPLADPTRALEFAGQAEDSVLTFPAWGLRARAYVADARGDRASALEQLRRARSVALSRQQFVDVAISEFQLGLRIGGTRGSGLIDEARDRIRQAGAAERLLHEDPGNR